MNITSSPQDTTKHRQLPGWTWFVPLLFFQAATQLSLLLRVDEGFSLWYLPIPVGIVLAQWFGPRVLLALMVNATLSVGFWGHVPLWQWPLFGFQETLKVGLSWGLFLYFGQGKAWLPDLKSTWRFLVWGLVLPIFMACAWARVQMILLGHDTWFGFWKSVITVSILDVLSPLALALPILVFGTAAMEKRGWSVTKGAALHPAAFSYRQLTPGLKIEMALIFIAMLICSESFSLSQTWFIYGVFLLWAALRLGFGAAVLGTAWTLFLILLLPAILHRSFANHWAHDGNLQNLCLNLITLCMAALLVGRALGDVYAEIQFRKSAENKYRTLFDSATDAIFLVEEDRILESNFAACALFGYSKEELRGARLDLLSPEQQYEGSDSAWLLNTLNTAALSGKTQRRDWIFKRKLGSHFEGEISLNAFDLEGKTKKMLVARDFTPRKKMELALVESEERFRQMAEHIQEIFFLLDRESDTMLYASPIAESILGIPIEDLKWNWASLDGQLILENQEKMGFFRDGGCYDKPFNSEFQFQMRGGEKKWLHLRSFLIRNGKGEVYRVAGVITDITAYKKVQAEALLQQQMLIQSDKLNSLGLMVSGVAHEINNPNNLVMLNADALDTVWEQIRPALWEYSHKYPGWTVMGYRFTEADSKIPALFRGISSGANRIKDIVSNLKDFARLEIGKRNDVISVAEVIKASLALTDHVVKRATDHFEVLIPEGLPNVKGSFQKIEQVLVNLITNACQALENTNQSIRVLAEYDRKSDEVVIRVEDNGGGIPEDHLPKITEPFFTTKREIGGTGLGLSVSYGILQEHGGQLQFFSQVGRGTVAEVRLPALLQSR